MPHPITIWTLNGEIYKIINVESLTTTYNEINNILSEVSKTLYFKIILNDKIIYHNLYNQKYDPGYNDLEEITLETDLHIIIMNFNKNDIKEILETSKNHMYRFFPFEDIYNSNIIIQNNCDAILTIFYLVDFFKKSIICEKYNNDIQIIKHAIYYRSTYLCNASDELKDNEEIVKLAITQYQDESVSEDLQETYISDNSNLVNLLGYVSDRLKDNYEIIIKAISIDGRTLQNASNRLKNNYEIVKLAVSNNGSAIEFASTELKNNYEIVKLAVSGYGYALKFVSNELKDNFDIVKLAVGKNGYALEFASENLKDNDEIVTLAINHYRDAIYYASERIQYNVMFPILDKK